MGEELRWKLKDSAEEVISSSVEMLESSSAVKWERHWGLQRLFWGMVTPLVEMEKKNKGSLEWEEL